MRTNEKLLIDILPIDRQENESRTEALSQENNISRN